MRRTRGSTRYLEWRIRLFGVGAILAVVGMAADAGWMVNLAVGVLVIGVVLRFAGKAPEATSTGEDRSE